MLLDQRHALGYGHRRNLKFYLSLYVASAVHKQVQVSADMLLQLIPEEKISLSTAPKVADVRRKFAAQAFVKFA